MILETKRLIIRQFTELDSDDFASLLANPEVMQFSSNGPLSKKQSKELLQTRILDHYKKHNFGVCALISKEDQHFIGYAGLIFQLIDGKEEVELGYRLFPAYWGKGLATEASLAICEYAFETLGLKQLISIIDSENLRSIHVAEKAGMHYWKDSIFHKKPVRIYMRQKNTRI